MTEINPAEKVGVSPEWPDEEVLALARAINLDLQNALPLNRRSTSELLQTLLLASPQWIENNRHLFDSYISEAVSE